MRPRRLTPWLAGALVLCGAAASGCREKLPAPAAGPADVALELFELAALDEPTVEQLDRRFGTSMDDQLRAALYDSIAALRPAQEPEVTRVTELDGLGRSAVDLSAGLPGGGRARYQLQLVGPLDGSWRVLWFQGPGVEWPPPRRPDGEGLTTSPPPS